MSFSVLNQQEKPTKKRGTIKEKNPKHGKKIENLQQYTIILLVEKYPSENGDGGGGGGGRSWNLGDLFLLYLFDFGGWDVPNLPFGICIRI